MNPKRRSAPAIKPPAPTIDPVFGNELGVGVGVGVGVGAVIVNVPGA
jgi:hypothetical protein